MIEQTQKKAPQEANHNQLGAKPKQPLPLSAEAPGMSSEKSHELIYGGGHAPRVWCPKTGEEGDANIVGEYGESLYCEACGELVVADLTVWKISHLQAVIRQAQENIDKAIKNTQAVIMEVLR